MQPNYPFPLDVAQWAVAAFVLAMTFLAGVLGGYLFGLTHLVRHGDGSQGSDSIWKYEDDD
jgi:hypothetical protein